MPLINVRIAAELAGKDRSTIIRAIEDGKLSAGKDPRGRYQIDPAELERVYGPLRSPDARTAASNGDASSHASAEAMLASSLTREIELMRELWDRERSAWEEERAFLRGMLEKTSEQVKLLTHQRETATQPAAMSLPRRTFWQWVRGR